MRNAIKPFKAEISRETAEEIVRLTVEIHRRVMELKPLIYGAAPKTTTRRLQGYLEGASYIRFQVESLLMDRAEPPAEGTWFDILWDKLGRMVRAR